MRSNLGSIQKTIMKRAKNSIRIKKIRDNKKPFKFLKRKPRKNNLICHQHNKRETNPIDKILSQEDHSYLDKRPSEEEPIESILVLTDLGQLMKGNLELIQDADLEQLMKGMSLRKFLLRRRSKIYGLERFKKRSMCQTKLLRKTKGCILVTL
jgi:hypothetical protein